MITDRSLSIQTTSTSNVKRAALCAALAVAISWNVQAAQSDSPKQTRHVSGIAIVGADATKRKPLNEAQAMALDDARKRARKHSNDLGYPWIDAGGTLRQRFATGKGKDIIPLASVSDETAVSYSRLAEVKHDVTTLARQGVPGADTIWRTSIDPARNRIVISVTKLSDSLLTALSARYGTELVAVHVDPVARTAHLDWGTRDDDHPTLSGAAKYITPDNHSCSFAFAWTTGFITAGHCMDRGGLATTPSGLAVGWTTESVEENIEAGLGTVPFPGSPWLQGDLALVRASDRSLIGPMMYVGGAASSETRIVKSMWNRSPMVGDRYCTGGAKTGELCGWEVTDTEIDILTDLLSWEWIENVVEGKRSGLGTVDGDSGGAVYTVNLDGTIVAKGVHSSSSTPYPNFHYGYFTDIWDAYSSLPGFLKTPEIQLSYRVRNGNSGQCLAIGSSSKELGASAIQWGCTGSSGQTWYVVPHPSAYPWVWIKNGSGKCLAIGSSSTAPGAQAIQWDCLEHSVGQRWLVQSDGSIYNGSGLCLAIGSSSTTPGAKAIQWNCIGSNTQKWYWEALN